MAINQDFDTYDDVAGSAESSAALSEEETTEEGGSYDEGTDPDAIRFSWVEMVFLLIVTAGGESLALAVKLIPLAGIALGACINAGISVFLLLWLYFIKGSTGHRFIKKALIRIAASSLFGAVGLPYIQTAVLVWVFLEARFESIKLATKLAEKAYGKFK
jgi:hypothetical protein